MAIEPPKLSSYGDSAVMVDYQFEGYSDAVNNHLHHLAKTLRTQNNWQEIVPSYKSVLVVFDLAQQTLGEAIGRIEETLKNLSRSPQIKGKTIEIPVVYGGKYGPDMAAIKKASGMSYSEIIETHSAQEYRVCMMGFIPGFCFLSEVPAVLQHPRHNTPRADVPAGSVGIAGWQTGIYGLESPGGWQIIGRTPLTLFDPARETPFLLNAGDTVRFVPSSKALFS